MRLLLRKDYGVLLKYGNIIYVQGSISDSSITGSFYGDASGVFSGSFSGSSTTTLQQATDNGSTTNKIISASGLNTNALNVLGNSTFTGSVTVSGSNTFKVIGPTQLSGSVDITGSANLNGYKILNSLDTGSLINNSQTSSMTVLSASYTTTASFVQTSQTASFVALAQTASYFSGSISNAISASYALTASFALNGGGGSTDTGSLLLSSSFNSFTSSYKQDSSSFNSRIDSLTLLTSSYILSSQTSSMTVLSASYAATASFATLSQTASYISNPPYWVLVPGSPIRSSDSSSTLTDTANGNLYNLLLGRTTILKWTDTNITKWAMVASSSYNSNTVTLNLIGDILTTSATMNTFKYYIQKSKPLVFAIAGTIAVGTDLTGRYYCPCALKVFGVDGYHGTAGSTNATTYDINKNGTTFMTTKLSIGSGATAGQGFTADDGTVTNLGDYISVDCDSISTTAPIDTYVELFTTELNNQYLS